MKKALVAVTTAFIALTTMFSSAADAGFKARIGLGVLALAPHVIAASKAKSAKRKYRNRKYQAAKRRRAKQKAYAKKRRAKQKAYAKKRRSKSKTVAKVKTAPTPVTFVDDSADENSTISMAKVETAEYDTETVFEDEETVAEKTAEVSPVAGNSDGLGCKKFFASVGMTLTVPCE